MALRRQVKNVVRNFTDIEVKVREATSNDPWGPSSSLTSEIADATYNVQAFAEIMTLLWKRINDHGKNWRHVYKSLVVLDYIVKTGSERVAQQCRENIFAIKTLKDFQFIDKDGKDQGINVREKSKMLVALLKDDERLKNERQRALKAKERFSQSEGGIGNTSFPKNRRFQGTLKYTESRGSVDDTNIPSQTFQEKNIPADSRSTDGRIDSEIEKVRPSNEAEEELQLQIALAMSREEAEKGEKVNQAESQLFGGATHSNQPQPATSTLLTLSDPVQPPKSNTALDPWMQPAPTLQTVIQPPRTQPVADPWGAPVQPTTTTNLPVMMNNLNMNQPKVDPWNNAPPPSVDPWDSQAPAPALSNDPWGMSKQPTAIQDPFASQMPAMTMSSAFTPIAPISSNSTGANEFSLFDSTAPSTKPKTESSFLSNGAHLVDVENILAAKPQTNNPTAVNPFMTSAGNTNPFLQEKPKPKSINEIRSDKSNIFASTSPSGDMLLEAPLQPMNNQQNTNNPFL
ncbi:epsin-2-like [Hydractinia symbiolongicarpus]|uniref:epsin-2-like n=1 Tax=Hydractinia symbiolongicarpus TaxID=13093 RepID=UPI00254E9FC8|nr:epsin-2-like [Hydractinia symbiolongicarpus]